MAAPDATLSYLATGRLAYGVTDLSTAWPHGGTGLGVAVAVYVSPPTEYSALPAEEDNAARKVLFLGGDVVLGVRLASWDADALAKIFPNTTTSSGEEMIEWPGSVVVAGDAMPEVADLVFTPLRSTHPGVILYSARALVEASARLALSSYRWLEVPALFLGLPNANGNVGAMSTFGQLALDP